MKIVNREKFMSMPSGTVYSLYDPCIFDGLNVKVSEPNDLYYDQKRKTLNDFVYVPLIDGFVKGSVDNNVNHAELENFEFDMYCTTRDGLYEDEQLFAIYEKEDILKLVARLTYSFLEADMN